MSRQIAVKVTPKAKHDRIEPDGSGGFKVWTTAAPDKGAANGAVTRMLAKELGIAPGTITLRRGATARHKVFEIPD